MKKQEGFAVLFVLAMSSGLLALSLAVWHQTSLLYDLVIEREQEHKHAAVARTFFQASTIMLADHINFFLEKKTLETLPFKLILTSTYELFSQQAYSALLIINKTKVPKQLLVELRLMKRDKNLKKMRWLCTLQNNGEKRRLIETSYVC